jgi:hypothetical protein
MKSIARFRRIYRSRCTLTIWAWIDKLRAETGSPAAISNQYGPPRECPGDADVLALTARELMGKPAQMITFSPTIVSS